MVSINPNSPNYGNFGKNNAQSRQPIKKNENSFDLPKVDLTKDNSVKQEVSTKLDQPQPENTGSSKIINKLKRIWNSIFDVFPYSWGLHADLPEDYESVPMGVYR